MRFLVFLFLTLSTLTAVAEEEISVEQLHSDLQRCTRAMNDTHIVFATRNFAKWNSGPSQVYHYDLWLQNKTVQARRISTNVSGEDWWQGHTGCTEPFNSSNLEDAVGTVICMRADEELRRSEFKLMTSGSTTQYSSQMILSRKTIPVTYPLPLVEVEREWTGGGQQPIVNQVGATDPAKWRILGRERIGTTETIKVEVPWQETLIPLNRHPGSVRMAPTLICWFSLERGHVPLKIENSCRYQYQGKEYEMEMSPDSKPFFNYEVSEVGSVLNDVPYPIAGKYETYQVVDSKREPFDPDELVDELLETGKSVFRYQMVLSTRDEWRVLKMERMSSDTPLWLEPPVECYVRDEERKEVYIAGVSDLESRRRLNMTGIFDRLFTLFKPLTVWIGFPGYTHRPSQNNIDLWSFLLFILVLIVVVYVLYTGLRSWKRVSGRIGVRSESCSISASAKTLDSPQ